MGTKGKYYGSQDGPELKPGKGVPPPFNSSLAGSQKGHHSRMKFALFDSNHFTVPNNSPHFFPSFFRVRNQTMNMSDTYFRVT